MDWVSRGGLFMVPILLLSVVAVGIFLERLWVLRKKLVFAPERLGDLEALLSRKKASEARGYCQRINTPVARICLAGLDNLDEPRSVIKESMEDRGRAEALELRKYCGSLQTIASVSPLLGLLGTVSGMIKVFDAISMEGVGNPGSLATGISEALITTAAGLCVAIPTFMAQRYLASRAEVLTHILEEYSSHMLKFLANMPGPTEKESS